MKNIKILLSIVFSLTMISIFAQNPVDEESWEKISELFTSIDQIGWIADDEQGQNTQNIRWMRLSKVYHEGCDLKLDYITDKKQNSSASCSVSILKVQPSDLMPVDISGIPSLKLELSGNYIFKTDVDGNQTGKTNTLYFRACYNESTYKDIKSAIAEVRKNCNW